MPEPCRYCGGATLDLDGVYETQHIEADCPMLTGLFTVEARDFPYGVSCLDCACTLSEGDTYVVVYDGAPHVGFILCVGCAALASV